MRKSPGTTAARAFTPAPVPMRLLCERCHELHIDEGAFATKPHHTHSCQFCGLTWRPAVVCTVGVKFLPGFKNELSPPAPPAPGHTATLMSHRTTGVLIEWNSTEWKPDFATGKGVAVWTARGPGLAFSGGKIPLDDLYRDYQVCDLGTWRSAFSVYAAHAHGCTQCHATKSLAEMCDTGRALFQEYARRFESETKKPSRETP